MAWMWNCFTNWTLVILQELKQRNSVYLYRIMQCVNSVTVDRCAVRIEESVTDYHGYMSQSEGSLQQLKKTFLISLAIFCKQSASGSIHWHWISWNKSQNLIWDHLPVVFVSVSHNQRALHPFKSEDVVLSATINMMPDFLDLFSYL